jgi:exopolysaccharide biosynthesis polyprenyl glycosylphosphotransferase
LKAWGGTELERGTQRALALLLGDAVFIPLAYAGAYFLRFGTLASFEEKLSPVFLAMATAGYLVVFYFFDLYALDRDVRNRSLAVHLIPAVGVSAVLASLLKYVFFLFPIGRGVLVIANTLLIVLVFAWHKVGALLFRVIARPSSVLFVGRGNGVDEIVSILASDPQNYQILGVLADETPSPEAPTDVSAARVIGSPRQLGEFLESRAAKIIILAEASGPLSLSVEGLLQAHLSPVEIIDIPEMYQRLKFRIPVDYIKEESWFLRIKGFALAHNHLVGKVKRVFDVALGSILFLVGLPLWPFIALFIKIESRGPVFYGQDRIGRNGIVFHLHKFRSMIERAESDEPVWAGKTDRRVTRVGRVLRKLHLDELPQLWNVLRGEMSLVGPRPERPEFVAALKRDIPFYALRHFVKPGLTGWAQINYPYAASTKDSKDKLEYDLYYISRMNPVFDLKILVETLFGALSGRHRDL